MCVYNYNMDYKKKLRRPMFYWLIIIRIQSCDFVGIMYSNNSYK